MQNKLDLTRVSPMPEAPLGAAFAGTSTDGRTVSLTNRRLLMNGVPCFGVSGEVHYCRVSPDQWKDTLIKARCGGVGIIATYVFWNVHEEIEGVFRFDGCRDLHRFLTLCRDQGLLVILRIGPFCHGEMRNGGLPDWLYGKPFEVRNNNPGYLACVRQLFAAIHSQADGLYFHQGGPIVGVQLENEYMHSSAPWELTTGAANEWVNGGQDGEEHIRMLKRIAQEVGILAPFYTCTAWGGGMAPVDEVLPLWGGYAYWPWIFYSKTGEHPCTPEFIYRDNHSNSVPVTYNFEPRYAPESMPYACCEMMGGMMCSYNYRFTLPYESVDALANIKLGSGCAMLGYYMYRGGTTPTGEKAPFLNENQISKRSYDYQAPIGEFGQRRASYYRLRTLHDFCVSFAQQLLDTATVLPGSAEDMQPEDTAQLRFCARVKDDSGFLFLNNFQDHLTLPARHDETVELQLEGETLSFGIGLASGENAILPFNLRMGRVLLKTATVQPITQLMLNGVPTWFFMIPDGMEPMLRFDKNTVNAISGAEVVLREDAWVVCPQTDSVTSFQADDQQIVVMTRAEAMHFQHLRHDGCDVAILSDTGVLANGQDLFLEMDGTDQTVLTMPHLLGEDIRRGPFAGSTVKAASAAEVVLAPVQVGPSRWTVDVPAEVLTGHKTVLLNVDYLGNIGQAFINGEMISDNFCNGQPWTIRLDDHAQQLEQHPLTLYIVPIKQGASVSVDSAMAARMEHVQGAIASLNGLSLTMIDDHPIRFD